MICSARKVVLHRDFPCLGGPHLNLKNYLHAILIQLFPGAPLTYFNDRGVRQRFIFYAQKNRNFRICLPQKIPQCFCISKFYYLSSGKLKHANFNFGFGQKQNYKLRLCYCWFELMKNAIPRKIPAAFIDQKKIPFGQNVRPEKILRTPPSLKYVSGAPGQLFQTKTPLTTYMQRTYMQGTCPCLTNRC